MKMEPAVDDLKSLINSNKYNKYNKYNKNNK